MNSKHWTAVATEKLRELAKTGKSFRQIGVLLGYSRDACIGKARREKIEKFVADTTPRPKKYKPAAVILKPTPIPPDVKVADMQLITMMQLTSNNCRYPVGEDEDMLFCGKQRHRGRPYCQEHADVCYKPMLPPTRSVRRL